MISQTSLTLWPPDPRIEGAFPIFSEILPFRPIMADTIRPDGTRSHGANTVVSLLHDFFRRHRHGEKGCFLHADNCAGQNKNKTVIAYLAWRVIVGLHEKITLSFMMVGHTRCMVDGCFGLLKRKYRRSDVYTLEQLSHVVDSSAACNIARLGSEVNWYEWDTFLHHFKKIPGISKRHHFVFASDKPGMVLVSDGRSSEVHEVNILKFEQHGLSMATLPPLLPRGGLSGDRQMYLYKKIRQFVPLLFRTSFVLLSTSDLRLTLHSLSSKVFLFFISNLTNCCVRNLWVLFALHYKQCVQLVH